MLGEGGEKGREGEEEGKGELVKNLLPVGREKMKICGDTETICTLDLTF